MPEDNGAIQVFKIRNGCDGRVLNSAQSQFKYKSKRQAFVNP